MKKILLLLTFACLPHLAGFCPNNNELHIIKSEGIDPYKSVWEAVCFVESTNNPLAYNRVEKAYGIAQIRKIRLKDYNERTGKHYTLKDCYSVTVSKEIFYYYVSAFDPDDIIGISRNWNGKGKKHKEYAKKIKKYLEKSII